MGELTRKTVHKSIEITVSLGDYQNIKVCNRGDWEISGDGQLTDEQHREIEHALAVDVKKQFIMSLAELGKGVAEAQGFFEACNEFRARKSRKKKESQEP